MPQTFFLYIYDDGLEESLCTYIATDILVINFYSYGTIRMGGVVKVIFIII